MWNCAEKSGISPSYTSSYSLGTHYNCHWDLVSVFLFCLVCFCMYAGRCFLVCLSIYFLLLLWTRCWVYFLSSALSSDLYFLLPINDLEFFFFWVYFLSFKLIFVFPCCWIFYRGLRYRLLFPLLKQNTWEGANKESVFVFFFSQKGGGMIVGAAVVRGVSLVRKQREMDSGTF